MPVTAAQLALVLGTQLVAVATPGPAVISITQKAIAQGRAPAIRYGFGLAFGATTWVLASMLGLGIVLTTYPALLMGMTALGGVYLIFIAWQIWRGATVDLAETDAAAAMQSSGFWAGYRLNISNPKPILFISALFLSVFPEPFTLASGAVVYLSMLSLELVFFTAVSMTLTTPAIRARALRAKPIIDRVAAVVIGALGVWLLWGLR